MIVLYDSNEKDFITNGLGVLIDAVSCVVKEELNGMFELTMEYPVDGQHYNDLAMRRIILAKPNKYSRPQPFRIYNISKPINCIVTINAEHISYDLSGIPVKPDYPFYFKGPQNGFDYIKANSVIDNPFNFTTDIEGDYEINVLSPRSARQMIGSDEESILGAYGGEYEFDIYDVKLHANRGENRGVVIRYGKNLTDLRQEENCNNVYTGIYPYYYVEDDGLMELDERIVNVEGTFDYEKILIVDLTSEFDEMPTQDELRKAAKDYIEYNGIGIPTVSLTVSFISDETDEERQILQDVRLGDYVCVKFVKLGVDSTAECVSTEFNVLANKYNSIELGEPVDNLVNTIAGTVKSQNHMATQVTSANNNTIAEAARAKEAEENLAKRIESLVGGTVTEDNVCEVISNRTEKITLHSGRLIIDSGNLQIAEDGSLKLVLGTSDLAPNLVVDALGIVRKSSVSIDSELTSIKSRLSDIEAKLETTT